MKNNDREYSADRFLTEEEAAELISFSPRTLQAWRQRKLGPPFMRIRRSIRYSEAALVGWLKQQTQEPDNASESGACWPGFAWCLT